MNDKTKPADPLGEMIQRAAWREAADEIQSRLADAQTAEKRAFYYLFLANLSKRLIVESNRRKDPESARIHLGEASKFHNQAKAETPHDMHTRNSFAEFCLNFQGSGEHALLHLEPFTDQDYAPRNDPGWQEHKRLAMRGAALALTGRMEESMSHLHEAYGETYRSTLPSAYKNALWFMSRRGIRLHIDAVDRLIELLSGFSISNEKNLTRLRASLALEQPADLPMGAT